MAVLLALPVAVFARDTPPQRDEPGYVSDVNAEWAGSLEHPAQRRAWAAAHRAELVQAGDAACAWLDRQPDAPRVDPSGRSAGTAVFARAKSELAGLGLEPSLQSEVIGLAWAYLCPGWEDDKTAPLRRGDD